MVDFYRKIDISSDEKKLVAMKMYNGLPVIIKDEHSPNFLIGGILHFNPENPKVYELKDKSPRIFCLHNLEKLLVSFSI